MSETLVVISKIKAYIKEKSDGMSTSGNFATAISDVIRSRCDAAIENTTKDRRKTVMDRDFNSDTGTHDALIVTSKLKAYIKEKSDGMSTAANVIPAISGIVAKLCDEAIANAQKDRRKTVMDRDLP